MDTSASLIGVGFLLLFTVPVLLVVYNQSNRNKKIRNHIEIYAQKHQIHLDQFEITHRIVLGFDKNLRKLIVSSVDQFHENINIVDLTKVETFTLYTPQTKTSGIEKVAIHLEGETPIKELLFYEEDDDAGADALVNKEIARKWLSYFK